MLSSHERCDENAFVFSMYLRKEINYGMKFEEVKGFGNPRDILVPQ
jgi:hypothetical protein